MFTGCEGRPDRPRCTNNGEQDGAECFGRESDFALIVTMDGSWVYIPLVSR
jgi:hypothetical protein